VVSVERQDDLEEVLNSPLEYQLNVFCDDNPVQYLSYALTEISQTTTDKYDESTDAAIPSWMLFDSEQLLVTGLIPADYA
jgi:hypothetical protein